MTIDYLPSRTLQPLPASAPRARSLRVGIYTPSYPGVNEEGGIGTYTQTLARALVEGGHEVHVLTPGQGPGCTDRGVHIHLTSTRYMRGIDRLLPGFGACWRVAQAMRGIVRQHQLDVVEFPNWQGYGVLATRLLAAPVVVRLHTSALETQRIDGLTPSRELAWDARREHWQARRAAALVTHSQVHRQAMAEELGIAEAQIGLVPHGVETSPTFERPARPPGPPRVVFLGRLEKRKGTLDLLHAARTVLRQAPEAEFVLIGKDRPHCPGDRTHAAYLRDEFSEREQRQIRLAGRLSEEEVNACLQTADVFVAPSLYESFGLIIPEAMRWELPVVSTRAGGIPEIVSHEETGLLVDPGAPDQLADAILRLLNDRPLRERLARAGRQYLEQQLSARTMAGNMARFYSSVLAKANQR